VIEWSDLSYGGMDPDDLNGWPNHYYTEGGFGGPLGDDHDVLLEILAFRRPYYENQYGTDDWFLQTGDVRVLLNPGPELPITQPAWNMRNSDGMVGSYHDYASQNDFERGYGCMNKCYNIINPGEKYTINGYDYGVGVSIAEPYGSPESISGKTGPSIEGAIDTNNYEKGCLIDPFDGLHYLGDDTYFHVDKYFGLERSIAQWVPIPMDPEIQRKDRIFSFRAKPPHYETDEDWVASDGDTTVPDILASSKSKVSISYTLSDGSIYLKEKIIDWENFEDNWNEETGEIKEDGEFELHPSYGGGIPMWYAKKENNGFYRFFLRISPDEKDKYGNPIVGYDIHSQIESALQWHTENYNFDPAFNNLTGHSRRIMLDKIFRWNAARILHPTDDNPHIEMHTDLLGVMGLTEGFGNVFEWNGVDYRYSNMEGYLLNYISKSPLHGEITDNYGCYYSEGRGNPNGDNLSGFGGYTAEDVVCKSFTQDDYDYQVSNGRAIIRAVVKIYPLSGKENYSTDISGWDDVSGLSSVRGEIGHRGIFVNAAQFEEIDPGSKLLNPYQPMEFSQEHQSNPDSLWHLQTYPFNFSPDVDIRNPKSLEDTGYFSVLYKYYDTKLQENQYDETSAPLTVQLYFYIREEGNHFTTRQPLEVPEGKIWIGFLDWGDGSEVEYNKEPFQVGGTGVIKHNYEKSGLYEIRGVMFSIKENFMLDEVVEGIESHKEFLIRIYVNKNVDYEDEFSLLGGNGYTYIPYKDTSPVVGGVSDNSIYKKTIKRNLGYFPDDSKIDINFKYYNEELESEKALAAMDEKYIGPILSQWTGSFPTEIGLYDDDNVLVYDRDSNTSVTLKASSAPMGYYSGDVNEVTGKLISKGSNEISAELEYYGYGSFYEELGNYLGDSDLSQIRYYSRPSLMWEHLGFSCDEIFGVDIIPLYNRSDSIDSTTNISGINYRHHGGALSMYYDTDPLGNWSAITSFSDILGGTNTNDLRFGYRFKKSIGGVGTTTETMSGGIANFEIPNLDYDTEYMFSTYVRRSSNSTSELKQDFITGFDIKETVRNDDWGNAVYCKDSIDSEYLISRSKGHRDYPLYNGMGDVNLEPQQASDQRFYYYIGDRISLCINGADFVIDTIDGSQRGRCYINGTYQWEGDNAHTGTLAPFCDTVTDGEQCYNHPSNQTSAGLPLDATDTYGDNEPCIPAEGTGIWPEDCSTYWVSGVSLGFACNVIGTSNRNILTKQDWEVTGSSECDRIEFMLDTEFNEFGDSVWRSPEDHWLHYGPNNLNIWYENPLIGLPSGYIDPMSTYDCNFDFSSNDYKYDDGSNFVINPINPITSIKVICENGEEIELGNSDGVSMDWPDDLNFKNGNQACNTIGNQDEWQRVYIKFKTSPYNTLHEDDEYKSYYENLVNLVNNVPFFDDYVTTNLYSGDYISMRMVTPFCCASGDQNCSPDYQDSCGTVINTFGAQLEITNNDVPGDYVNNQDFDLTDCKEAYAGTPNHERYFMNIIPEDYNIKRRTGIDYVGWNPGQNCGMDSMAVLICIDDKIDPNTSLYCDDYEADSADYCTSLGNPCDNCCGENEQFNCIDTYNSNLIYSWNMIFSNNNYLFTDNYGQPLNQQIDINDLDPNYCSYFNTDTATCSDEFCTGDGEWPIMSRPCYGCMVYKSLPKAEIGGFGYTVQLATTDLDGTPVDVGGGISSIIYWNSTSPWGGNSINGTGEVNPAWGADMSTEVTVLLDEENERYADDCGVCRFPFCDSETTIEDITNNPCEDGQYPTNIDWNSVC